MTVAAYSRLLRENRNFRLLWLAQIVSEMGDWFYSVAIFSFLLETTGSAQTVAFAFLLQVLPQVLMAPTAGVINDRMSRKRVMIYADWARAAIVLCMLAVRTREWIWLLFVLLFLETVHWALFEPGRSAVIPNIVREEDVATANALSATTWSVNFMLGSGLGGLVAAFFGRPAVFVINALSFVASALLVSRMRFHEPHAANVEPLRASDLVNFTPVAEGARYVARDGRLLATLLCKAGLSVMGSNWVILPILGERVFPLKATGLSGDQGGTLGMSILMAARGLGAIGGAFLGGTHAGTSARRCRAWILTGFLMGGCGYLALSGAGSLGTACLALVLAHAGGSSVWTASTTLLQQQTEDRFRGRVFSAELAATMLMMSTSSFTAGRLSDAGVSVRTLAAGTGLAMLAPAALWMLAQRLWRRA